MAGRLKVLLVDDPMGSLFDLEELANHAAEENHGLKGSSNGSAATDK